MTGDLRKIAPGLASVIDSAANVYDPRPRAAYVPEVEAARRSLDDACMMLPARIADDLETKIEAAFKALGAPPPK